MEFIQLSQAEFDHVNNLIKEDKDIFDYICKIFELNRYQDWIKYNSNKGVVCVLKSLKD